MLRLTARTSIRGSTSYSPAKCVLSMTFCPRMINILDSICSTDATSFLSAIHFSFHGAKPVAIYDYLGLLFGNIHDTLFPGLAVQWNGIRLLDYKRVNDFNKDMLRLQARLNFCGREITEDDMIYKTLTTFPTSAFILANQYKLEYDNKRITTFNKLISLLQVAERHNEVLLNNNARPEANYGKMKGGKNSNAKGFGRDDPYPRGNNAPCGKGRGGGGNKVQKGT